MWNVAPESDPRSFLLPPRAIPIIAANDPTSEFAAHSVLPASCPSQLLAPHNHEFVFKTFAQATMLVCKVLLTPVDVALAPTSGLRVGDGIPGFLFIFFALLHFQARRLFFPQLKQLLSNCLRSLLFFSWPRSAVVVPFDADKAFEYCCCLISL